MNTKVSDNSIWINDSLVYTIDGDTDSTKVEIVNSDIDAMVSKVYLCDTTENGFDITLPSGSNLGEYFTIIDIKGTFKDNPVKLKGNGSTIMGKDENFLLDVNDREYKVIYVDNDWRVLCSGLNGDFVGQYQGAHNIDPDKRNDESDLQEGDFYWNNADKCIKFYDDSEWKKYASGGGGVLSFKDINSNTTAETFKAYLCNVSDGSFKITLPNSPEDNDAVEVINYKGSFKENNLTIDGNGKKINGEDTYTCKLDDSSYMLQYSENNTEWICLINSSFSLGSLFAEFMCEVPTLSNQSSTEVNERDYIEIDIDNYDENAEYVVDNDLVVKFRYKSDKTFKVYFGSVDEDTDTTFKVRAIKTGYISSSWSNEISVKVKDRPEKEDDAIINDAFADNKGSSSDCDVTNDKVIFTKDGGEYIEKVTEQGDNEEDWTSYQTIARIKLEKMNIVDDTDKNTLTVTDEKVKDVSKCYIISDGYPDGAEIDIGNVDEIEVDNTSTLDILDDNSCIACYNLDNNATDLSGNYNGSWDGDEAYEDAKYDKGAKFNENNGISLKDTLKDIFNTSSKKYSVSFFVKQFNEYSNNDIHMIFGAFSTSSPFAGPTFWIENQKLRFRMDSNTYASDQEQSIITTDNLNHVVIISNASTVKVLINKEEKFSINWDSVLDVNRISFGFNKDSQYWSGIIDQCRIFNKELSDDEIDIVYNEKYKKYKANISSNDLDKTPTSAYFIEENVTIKTALTKDDDPTDDDFNEEKLGTWTIDNSNEYKENSYKKISDYTGTKFQRKVTGDKNANITYLKTNMWKDQ